MKPVRRNNNTSCKLVKGLRTVKKEKKTGHHGTVRKSFYPRHLARQAATFNIYETTSKK
jgi:hypothetical protein